MTVPRSHGTGVFAASGLHAGRRRPGFAAVGRRRLTCEASRCDCRALLPVVLDIQPPLRGETRVAGSGHWQQGRR